MSYYECYRCKYRSRRITDMKRHLNKKVKCPKNIESYNFTEEELMNMSLLLHNDNYFIENNINKEDLKKNICTFCFKVFSRPDNVKRHQKNFCKKLTENILDKLLISYNYK